MASMTRPAPKLIQKPVLPTLFAMAVPMLGGTFAMNAFNLTDTWFVAQLGTLPLAAMGFSFPVVMFLMSITRGLGTGATAVVSHALGRHDQELARRITTHTLFLATVVVLGVSIGGLLTIDLLFNRSSVCYSLFRIAHSELRRVLTFPLLRLRYRTQERL